MCLDLVDFLDEVELMMVVVSRGEQNAWKVNWNTPAHRRIV